MRLIDKLGRSARDVRTINALLTGAEAEARRTGEALPGAEHLLSSALALPDGSARRAFERVGADPDALRPAIAGQHAEALRAVGIEPVSDDALDAAGAELTTPGTGPFRATASGRRAFQAAGDLARSTSSPLAGAHVVIAVTRMEHGTGPRALGHMGIDRGALAAAARDELDS